MENSTLKMMLPLVLTGKMGLPILTDPHTGIKHIRIYGTEQTFCGHPVNPTYKRGVMRYGDIKVPNVCAACRTNLDEMLQQT